MDERRYFILIRTLEVWADYFCAAAIGTGAAMLAFLAIDAAVQLAISSGIASSSSEAIGQELTP